MEIQSDPKLEDELSIYEDRVTLNKINDRENEIQDIQKKHDEAKKLRMAMNREMRAKERDRMEKNSRRLTKQELLDKEVDINRIVTAMKVNDYKEIVPYYDSIVKADEGIEQMIVEYNSSVQSMELEIGRLKQVYLDEVQREKEAREEEFDETRLRVRSQRENDEIDLLEKQFSELTQAISQKEHENKTLSTILNDSCTTVSRIMYQMEKRVRAGHPRKIRMLKSIRRISSSTSRMLG